MTKSLDDYTVNISLVDFNLEVELCQLFPRIGYLVCNLFLGNNDNCRFNNYSADYFRSNQLYITGLLSGASLQVSLKGRGKCYAFKMHPVVAHHLLEIPMTEVTNKQVIVSDLLDIRKSALRKVENNEETELIDNKYFEEALLHALPSKSEIVADPIYRAVNEIIIRKGKVRIGSLASKFAMSDRTFRRKFLIRVGLPPQGYARIWKIQAAIEYIQKHPSACLEEVAFNCGYFDVAHLAKDFKKSVTIAPSKVDRELDYPLLKSYLGEKPSG